MHLSCQQVKLKKDQKGTGPSMSSSFSQVQVRPSLHERDVRGDWKARGVAFTLSALSSEVALFPLQKHEERSVSISPYILGTYFFCFCPHSNKSGKMFGAEIACMPFFSLLH